MTAGPVGRRVDVPPGHRPLRRYRLTSPDTTRTVQAEREGFEPPGLAASRFQGGCICPLCHRSAGEASRADPQTSGPPAGGTRQNGAMDESELRELIDGLRAG